MSHFDSDGQAHMVDVSTKAVTSRTAVASGEISMSPSTKSSMMAGENRKGDVLGVARLAAISASKWTSHLIPLCHAIAIEAVAVDFQWVDGPQDSSARLVCQVKVTTSAKTGVEMEAMTAVSVGLLTVYDMIKSVDRAVEIGPIRLEQKSGGKSGEFSRSGSH
ncbi:cyclic pyranopterin monophosphate synthase MoaC [Rubripirellula amarantea]|nr:cyclic pyranopterin monophosphate synthase MoaC [Rubripirellula amarantea]